MTLPNDGQYASDYLSDAQYVSRFANDILALDIFATGVPADPTGTVTTSFINRNLNTVVFTRAATRTGVGQFQVVLASAESTVPGDYQVRWQYQLGGVAQDYSTFVTVGPSAPNYDRLAPGMKEIVDQVMIRFADLFDSPQGGPHLQTYFETHFGRNRVAQLLRVAIGRMNTIAQPHQTYTLDDGAGGAAFPILAWGSLAEQALYVEVIKHLRRSYVEQPALTGGDAARLDRRDYLDRWGLILADEEEDLKQRLGVFKIANMGLGRPAVLVSGGVYGRFAPTRYAGSAVARGRFWSRMY